MSIVPDQKWFVIRDGVRAAVLLHPRQEDMFWFSYEVRALPEAREPVFEPKFWSGVFEVEEAVSGGRVGPVFAGKVQPHADGQRVWIRGFVPYRSDPTPRSRSWRSRLLGRLRGDDRK